MNEIRFTKSPDQSSAYLTKCFTQDSGSLVEIDNKIKAEAQSFCNCSDYDIVDVVGSYSLREEGPLYRGFIHEACVKYRLK